MQNQSDQTSVMSVKDWMLTLFLLMIPIVNIVMLFVWAFGDAVNENKRNYCRASLLWAAIILGIYIVLLIIMFAFFASSFHS